MSKRRRIWSVIGVIAAILVVWIAATLFLSPAYASTIPFSMAVRSRLLADYNPDDGKSLFTALKLSIMGESLRDQGLSDEEADKRELALEASLDDPVPTATAFNFDGSNPYTATPTDTATPTATPTATSTSTNTPQPTATKTSTAKPTNTPKPPTSVADSKQPQIQDWALDPAPGPDLGTCEIDLSVEVRDPAFSEGVASVEAKHSIPSDPENHHYFSFSGSGGFVSGPGTDWLGTFTGQISLDDVHSLEEFDVYFKAKDSAGNVSSWSGPFHYRMDSVTDCS